jgi:hypothetical protein
MKRLCIGLSGGLGKHVSFTALLPKLKEKYEEIYITAPYGDVFLGNPHVTKVNPYTDGSFYKNIMCQDDTDIVGIDSYDHPEFIKKKIHIFEAWADFCGVNIGNPMDLKTELYLTETEKYNADKALNEVRKTTKDKFILIQMNGGQSSINYQEGTQEFNFFQDSVVRFYPFDYYIQLIKDLKKKFPGHAIIRYGLTNESIPSEIANEVMTIPMPIGGYKTYYTLAKRAAAVICIDSSLQHICAGIKPSVVIWGQTAPEHFGYSIHKNLRKETRDSYAYFRPFGDLYQNTLFPEPEEIIEALKHL